MLMANFVLNLKIAFAGKKKKKKKMMRECYFAGT